MSRSRAAAAEDHSDRVLLDIAYAKQLWFFRVAAVVVPALAFVVTKRLCTELHQEEQQSAA